MPFGGRGKVEVEVSSIDVLEDDMDFFLLSSIYFTTFLLSKSLGSKVYLISIMESELVERDNKRQLGKTYEHSHTVSVDVTHIILFQRSDKENWNIFCVMYFPNIFTK